MIVSGITEDGSTFASAQVSMQIAETRINAARNEFCELMNRINERLTEYIPGTYNMKEVPQFNFQPLDMSGRKALRESCKALWEEGVVSTKTMMETQGYSMDLEAEQREQEKKDGIDEILQNRQVTQNAAQPQSTEQKEGPGRPEKDDSERTSDPENAIRGKMPKPSSPEGSMGDEEV